MSILDAISVRRHDRTGQKLEVRFSPSQIADLCASMSHSDLIDAYRAVDALPLDQYAERPYAVLGPLHIYRKNT